MCNDACESRGKKKEKKREKKKEDRDSCEDNRITIILLQAGYIKKRRWEEEKLC